jgi:HK97 family phage prohead protease
VPSPRPDEDRESFLERCTETLLADGEASDEDEAEDACALIWAQSRSASTEGKTMTNIVRRKVHASNADGMSFILSDGSVDRMNDVVRVDGWELMAFKSNPICLFNHNSSFPIGTWQNVRIENNALRADLKLAPKEASQRIAEIHALIGARVLRGTSVGFREISSRPRTVDGKTIGIEFLRQELLECSIVSIGANPAALAVAKALNISDDTRRLVFAESDSARRERTRRAREAMVRGILLLNDAEYLRGLRKRDPTGAARLEKRMREFGLKVK